MDHERDLDVQLMPAYVPSWTWHHGLGPSNRITVRASSPSAIPRSVSAGLTAQDGLWILDEDIGALSVPSKDHVKTPSMPSPILDTSEFTFLPRKAGRDFRFTLEKQNSPCQQIATKRCRHRLDVDGPNTAALGCKKRRLRVQLITSRLSQPYSQPATHILNREGMKSGDRRFSKMATSFDATRRQPSWQANAFLRFSVTNRLRRRLGLEPEPELVRPYDEDVDDEEAATTFVRSMSLVPQAPWKPQDTATLPLSGGHYLRSARSCLMKSSPIKNSTVSSTLRPKTQNGKVSQPSVLPSSPSDSKTPAGRESPSAKPPCSSELRVPPCDVDELEEDAFAYLHIDEDVVEEGIQDEADHVYSDFSVLFGGAESNEDNHSYEEYLDELDGITWSAM